MERPRDQNLQLIGCCGAYCKTCRAYTGGACRGCTIGYRSGDRDINKAKCSVKVCCLRREFRTCADCPDYPTCATIRAFHGKRGYKYRRYREALEFIRTNGCAAFVAAANRWKAAFGPLPDGSQAATSPGQTQTPAPRDSRFVRSSRSTLRSATSCRRRS